MSQLSLLDRTINGYAGVDASAVAAAERVTLDAVHDSRKRLGRRPSDGQPVSPHVEQADRHARRARNLHRAGMSDDAQAAWGEANYQASQALLDELGELARLMRDNRSPTL
jgi:hypothetical protein